MPCSVCKANGHNKRTCPLTKTDVIVQKPQKKDDCAICLCPIQDKNFAVTSCSHMFCLTCLATHLRLGNSCPLCRNELLSKPSVRLAISREERQEAYDEGFEAGFETAEDNRTTEANAYQAYQNGFYDGVLAERSREPTHAPSWITGYVYN